VGPLQRVNLNQWIKCRNPVILGVIHHRQNPLDSTRFISLRAGSSGRCLWRQ
jgi:hypothetical protein